MLQMHNGMVSLGPNLNVRINKRRCSVSGPIEEEVAQRGMPVVLLHSIPCSGVCTVVVFNITIRGSPRS